MESKLVLTQPSCAFMEVKLNAEAHFECSVCQLLFEDKEKLTAHKTVHNPIKNCPSCDKAFVKPEKLHKHFVREHTEFHAGSLTCSRCSIDFNAESSFIRHIRRKHTRVFHLKCYQCEETFLDARDLELHVNKHLSVRPYSCSVCSKSFQLKPWLDKHMMSHGNSRHHCSKCSKSYSTENKLADHMRTHQDPTAYQCEHCGKNLSSRSCLLEHLKLHTKFTCKVCGETFDKRLQWQYHKLTHAGIQSFMCSVCGHSFAERHLLRQHMKTHGEREWSCDVCLKAFTTKKHMLSHMRKSHTRRDVVPCPRCDRKFSTPSQLRYHMFVHTRHSDHTCPQCGKKHATAARLNKHIRSHSTPKPFACPKCDRAYASKHVMREHVSAVHDGLRRFKCEPCGVSFLYKRGLNRHREKKHSLAAELNGMHVEIKTDSDVIKQEASSVVSKPKQATRNNIFDQLTSELASGQEEAMDLTATEVSSESSQLECDVSSEAFSLMDIAKMYSDPVDMTSSRIVKNTSSVRLPKQKLCGKKAKVAGKRANVQVIRKRLTSLQRKKYNCKICKRQFLNNAGLGRHKKMHQKKALIERRTAVERRPLSADPRPLSPESGLLSADPGPLSTEPNVRECVVKSEMLTEREAENTEFALDTPARVNDELLTAPVNVTSLVVNDTPPACSVQGKGKFTCKVCKRQFVNNAGLGRHLKVHNNKMTHQRETDSPESRDPNALTKVLTKQEQEATETGLHTDVSSDGTLCVNPVVSPSSVDVDDSGAVRFSRDRSRGVKTKLKIKMKKKANLTRKRSTSLQGKTFNCKICKRQFVNNAGLGRHVKVHDKKAPHRRDALTASASESTVKTEVSADQEQDITEMALNAHVKTGENLSQVDALEATFSFPCKICDVILPSHVELTRHVKIHVVRRPSTGLLVV